MLDVRTRCNGQEHACADEQPVQLSREHMTAWEPPRAGLQERGNAPTSLKTGGCSVTPSALAMTDAALALASAAALSTLEAEAMMAEVDAADAAAVVDMPSASVQQAQRADARA